CEIAMHDGSRRRVILERSARPDDAARRAYIGATIGRYANRIGHARLSRGGIALQPNPGSAHHPHGRPEGLEVREWDGVEDSATAVRLALVSPDGDQGYPGELRADVTYRLVPPLAIEMEARATVTAPSPVCLTNHAYFNLDGQATDVRDHRLRIA